MFLLIRYQIVVASTKEINFTRQFSKVSLVHRTETNIARQFLEFCPFIVAVQQNFRDVSTNRLRNGSCAQFAANGKRKCWPFLRRQIYSAPGFWLLHQRQLLLLHLEQHPDRAQLPTLAQLCRDAESAALSLPLRAINWRTAIAAPFFYDDADLGWRLTECRAKHKEREYSEQSALHLRLFISCCRCCVDTKTTAL